MLPAHRFGRFEAEQDIGRAQRDLRRQHFLAETQVRGNHPAALRHAGDFGFLDIMAERDGRLGENFGRRHDALAADADDEDVGVFAHLRPRNP